MQKKPDQISQKVVTRLCEYRHVLSEMARGGERSVFSHDLAKKCGVTAAQVRRDLMDVGVQGNSSRGYDVNQKLVIDNFLGFQQERRMVLVGIGNLGRALLDFFAERNPLLVLAGAFDSDTRRVDRVIHGVRCYHVNDLEDQVKALSATIGVITVPADHAQEVAWRLAEAGVTGLLNFAPVQLRVPGHVYVENLNLSIVFEKVAFFAGHSNNRK